MKTGILQKRVVEILKAELRTTDEILKLACAYFAQAEPYRYHEK